jgi:hypothetical protein
LEKGESSTLQQHLPIAAAFLIIPNKALKLIKSSYHYFVGRNCITSFLASLEIEVERVCKWNDYHTRKVMQPLTLEQQQQHDSASTCYLCHKAFDEKHPKVKEHCHLTGRYRGPACQPCNTKARLRRSTIPVIFHNFKGYDAHHIVREGIISRPHWELDVIATSSESYLNLRVAWGENEKRKKISFIDSLQFLHASLANLVKQCPNMSYTDTLPWPASVTQGKGVFPYSYFDSEEKMHDDSLPPITAFFDTLTQTSLKEEDYKRAQDAWVSMNCKTFGEYMLSK